MSRKIIVIDDEQSGVDVLTNLITEFVPTAEIIATYSNAYEAVSGIKKHRPDIVFSDIEMPEMSGIELVTLIDNPTFKTVFVTAHEKYAIQAIRHNAFDYLLKPIRIKELLDLFNRIDIELDSLPTKNEADTIMLSTAKKVCFVHLNDIIMIKGEGSYSTFYLEHSEPILVSKNLAYYQRIIDSTKFFRSHQSYLVNLDHVDTINLEDGLLIELSQKMTAHLSTNRKQDFISAMKSF